MGRLLLSCELHWPILQVPWSQVWGSHSLAPPRLFPRETQTMTTALLRDHPLARWQWLWLPQPHFCLLPWEHHTDNDARVWGLWGHCRISQLWSYIFHIHADKCHSHSTRKTDNNEIMEQRCLWVQNKKSVSQDHLAAERICGKIQSI